MTPEREPNMSHTTTIIGQSDKLRQDAVMIGTMILQWDLILYTILFSNWATVFSTETIAVTGYNIYIQYIFHLNISVYLKIEWELLAVTYVTYISNYDVVHTLKNI